MEKGRLLPVSQPEKSLPGPSWEMQPTCSCQAANAISVEQGWGVEDRGAQVTVGGRVTKIYLSCFLQSRTWSCITRLHV